MRAGKESEGGHSGQVLEAPGRTRLTSLFIGPTAKIVTHDILRDAFVSYQVSNIIYYTDSIALFGLLT